LKNKDILLGTPSLQWVLFYIEIKARYGKIQAT